MGLTAFTFLIYFCFAYLAVTMVVCTVWVIRDRGKLKRKAIEDQIETNTKTIDM
ncbi:hypothetical protein [Halalkalibacter alkaliphilus]|uniref:Heme exporter protein D n=1 Tax=Halalkalibacter alkaliphilus TaxID=2917993 RepID=A0A9X2CXA1_9BACI|nr:hypothetical protein [Halalkalibacter alkaliphilus]MCL7749968.1 hypothetical protein [Halalkalibacter alkaliphilus]